jgi:hypothetical protein
MKRINRRRLLRLSGVGALAAGTGGLGAILAAQQAPAYAQGATLQWLKFVDFVPVSDQLLKGKIADECQKALGIKLSIETINGDGVQARITAAIQAGTGPDILMAVNNWPQLYAGSVVDVSDVAEEIGKRRAAITRPRTMSLTTAKSGSPFLTRSSGCCSSTALPGSKRLASVSRIFRRPGTTIEPSAKRSRPSSALTARPWPTRSVTVLRSGTPIYGRGAARRSRPTARPWH